MKTILFVNDKGVYMILLFAVYLFYLGIYAFTEKDIEFVTTGEPGMEKQGLQIVLFNTDIIQLIGVFSLAYMIHNCVAGMMKTNHDSSKNPRDLLIAYLIVFLLYSVLGVFGSFGVAAI
eukprot:CAMPEP_0170524560 /NCGR_PEP_ID=MMETSP0209-20121228/10032_1 /TAXON_ID=665100 ORGANISM="Litonotus pictus, Strain P1" /NCGR_SAMPLE_ID=MMETSP0209 /ASSEMBLY_ACC=CAM_ASM_000301 /LENGTH=118 /DNA_ID=CAMNT_0010813329 /DNA_START=273 /DNA_END=629 /DNA_ORIENTATION=-